MKDLLKMNSRAHKQSSKTSLDKDFIKCFAPIHIIQTFLGASRLNIKNNTITRITANQKLYTFFWIIGFTISFFYFEWQYYKDHYGKDSVLHGTCTVGVIKLYISYLSNIIHVRFYNTKTCGAIFLTVQKVDSILPLKEYANLKRKHFYLNLFLLILLITSIDSGFIYYVVLCIDYPILTIFWALGMLVTYIEMLLAGSLIYYLLIRLRYLNKIVKYNIDLINPDCFDCLPTITNHDLLISEISSGNLNLDKFLQSLKKILKSYDMIVELFSFTVFNVAATSFTWTLVIIVSTVERISKEYNAEITIIVTSLWILYYFTLLSVLAYTSDLFLQEVKQTKLQCIHVMSYRFEGSIRKGASDILRIVQLSQPIFSVYGIFILDKSFIFKLIGLITTNVVVLIQFVM